MKLVPVALYDVASQQAWLEDEAARGYFLADYGRAFAHFTKGEPKAVRYRLEPMVQKDEWLSLDRKDAYEALGWDYVTSVGNAFHIWRCDDPDAPELDTDPEVRAMAYEYQAKRMRRSDLFTAGFLLALCALVLWAECGRNFLRQVDNWEPMWKFLFLSISLGGAAVEVLREHLVFRRFVRGLKNGEPQPHRRPYRLARIVTVLVLVGWVGLLSIQISDLMEPNGRPFLPVESYDETVPCLDLGPGKTLAISVDNWRTPEQWWMRQDLEIGEVRSSYYRFWTEVQSRYMVRQLLRDDEYQLVELTGVDGAWHAVTEWGEDWVFRTGNRVLTVFAYQDLDLAPYLEDCAALLQTASGEE